MKSHQITIAIVILIKLQVKGQERLESNCGRRLVHLASNEGDWPWHAAIYHAKIDSLKYICGGTVLNSNSILTAAHCVVNRPIRQEKFVVQLGKHYLKYPGNTQQFDVSSIILHPAYSTSNYSNDIAIIRLSNVVIFNNYIQPICLWSSNKVSLGEVVGKIGEVIGWGNTETNMMSNILRHVYMPVVSKTTCLKSNPNLFGYVLSDNNFCAGFRNGTSACNGDGGGSLSFEENGVHRIRGIVSLSPVDIEGLCDPTEYVVFTDVAKYLTWIQEVVQSKLPEPERGNSVQTAGIGTKADLDKKTTITSADLGACLIPEGLPDTIKVYYEADMNKEISKGSYAVPYSTIIYKCRSAFTLVGNTNNQCFEGKWSADHPVCTKFCSQEDISGATITASCEYLGATISCMQPLPPQTTATINCAVGYRKPDRTVVSSLKCDNNGQWDYYASKCEQICGEEVPHVVSLIVGGKKVNITKIPWHVGIYSNIVNKKRFDQICGGTIINAKVVISAAHCFWDTRENQFYDAKYFKVGAGKYYRNFRAKEQIKPQFRNVKRIEHKQEYIDYVGYYAEDIALLILTDHLRFNIYVKPICLESDLDFNEKNVQPGLVGKVAGWGLETSGGKSSPELKYIDLPAIEYNQCKQKFSSDMQPFITGDKFCAGYTNGLSVCQGDSGGGFAYSQMVGTQRLFFLRGIVSTGGFKDGSCDNENYSLFTNIQIHIKMIIQIESENRPK